MKEIIAENIELFSLLLLVVYICALYLILKVQDKSLKSLKRKLDNSINESKNLLKVFNEEIKH